MDTQYPSATSDTPDDDLDLSLDELAQRVGTSTRTIRFYIAQALLPGPGARGKSASYGAEHLVRLRLIRLLSARHLPLAEIQALLRGLSLGEARELLATEEERSGQLRAAEGRQSPRDYVSALLDDAQHRRQGVQGILGHAARPDQVGAYPSAPRKDAPGGGVAEQLFDSPGASLSGKSGQSTEVWSRWVLAPGVELHVRADAREPWRALIRRLLRAAGARDDESGVGEAGTTGE